MSTSSTTACGATPRSQNLAKLKPFFDRKYGNVTPGNSSQITDGAAWLILASEDAGDEATTSTPLGRIVDSEWAGLDPGAPWASARCTPRRRSSSATTSA